MMNIEEKDLRKVRHTLGQGLCKFIDDEQFSCLSSFMERRFWTAGEVLWHEGDPYDYMAIIISGEIEILKETEFKGNRLIMGILGQGSIVGDLSFFDGGLRSVSANALEESCLLIIKKQRFDRLMEEQPALGVALMKGMIVSISAKLKQAYQRLSEVL